ncbi:ABC transporter permease [Rheinheimera muenzenbergensis]|uniref:ABC transporter permease n=1 Tax=Rheinheimera muenzenbergensis TaxID=1193628 RepID=A0ABU8C3V1_9GAMM
MPGQSQLTQVLTQHKHRHSAGHSILHSLNKTVPSLAFLLPLLVLAAVWQYVTSTGWFPPELMVPPAVIGQAFSDLWHSGELSMHLSVSLSRLAVGFVLGCLIGMVFGLLMGISPLLEDLSAPLFNIIRQVPSVALIPILILLFGIGETFKILIVIKAAFFPVALAAYDAVRNVSRATKEVAKVYQLSTVQTFQLLLLPATIAPVITGMRLGLGRSWGVLVGAELLAAESGIGQMMEFGRQMFQLDVVMVGVLLTGIIGFSLDRAFKVLKRRLNRWQLA